MKFVLIPAGTFKMGSPSNELLRGYDERQHRVTISKSFYMQTTEVTQGQWRKVMGSNPSHFKNCGDNCPVEMVSWDDAQKFIRKLNQREGTDKYRLPTEAEWEYTCRSGSDTAFVYGGITEISCGHDPNLDAIAWYCGNSGRRTHPVAEKRPNAWGLYDMHGNVGEWCQDWHGAYPSGHVTDPTGPSSGQYRMLRGGSWGVDAWFVRSAYRGKENPGGRNYSFGFRVARTF
jgi:formylglycine-generating enzyme required for sulfatase activity